MTTTEWYQILLERHVTTEVDISEVKISRLTRRETQHPELDWEQIYKVVNSKYLSGNQTSFAMKLINNILPTKSRLFRMNISPSSNCELCNSGAVGDLAHDLIECDYNGVVNDWIMAVLYDIDPSLINADMDSHNIVTFNLPVDSETEFAVWWFLIEVFQIVWGSRMSQKPVSLAKTKAYLNAQIQILKRSRLNHIFEQIETAMNFVIY